jgi:hypothetical protein
MSISFTQYDFVVYGGQRLQHAPEKGPEPAPAERSQTGRQRRQDRARPGACAVGYLDASGFC